MPPLTRRGSQGHSGAVGRYQENNGLLYGRSGISGEGGRGEGEKTARHNAKKKARDPHEICGCGNPYFTFALPFNFFFSFVLRMKMSNHGEQDDQGDATAGARQCHTDGLWCHAPHPGREVLRPDVSRAS